MQCSQTVYASTPAHPDWALNHCPQPRHPPPRPRRARLPRQADVPRTQPAAAGTRNDATITFYTQGCVHVLCRSVLTCVPGYLRLQSPRLAELPGEAQGRGRPGLFVCGDSVGCCPASASCSPLQPEGESESCPAVCEGRRQSAPHARARRGLPSLAGAALRSCGACMALAAAASTQRAPQPHGARGGHAP